MHTALAATLTAAVALSLAATATPASASSNWTMRISNVDVFDGYADWSLTSNRAVRVSMTCRYNDGGPRFNVAVQRVTPGDGHAWELTDPWFASASGDRIVDGTCRVTAQRVNSDRNRVKTVNLYGTD